MDDVVALDCMKAPCSASQDRVGIAGRCGQGPMARFYQVPKTSHNHQMPNHFFCAGCVFPSKST